MTETVRGHVLTMSWYQRQRRAACVDGDECVDESFMGSCS